MKPTNNDRNIKLTPEDIMKIERQKEEEEQREKEELRKRIEKLMETGDAFTD